MNLKHTLLISFLLLQMLLTFQYHKYDDDRKFPLYLGLFSNRSNETLELFQNFVNTSLVKLQEKYPDDNIISNAKQFNPPPTFHTTVLYLGDNASLINSSYYENFKVGYQEYIKVMTLVFVPDKIMCTPVFPKQNVIKISNQFPHVTQALNYWSAEMSNDIIAALVLQNSSQFENGVFRDLYYSGKLMDPTFVYFNKFENILVDNEVVTAYVVKIPFGKKKGFQFLATAQQCFDDACNVNTLEEYEERREDWDSDHDNKGGNNYQDSNVVNDNGFFKNNRNNDGQQENWINNLYNKFAQYFQLNY